MRSRCRSALRPALSVAVAVALLPAASSAGGAPTDDGDRETVDIAELAVEEGPPLDHRWGFAADDPDRAEERQEKEVSGQHDSPSPQGGTMTQSGDPLPAPDPGAEAYLRPADGVFDVRGGGFGHGIGMSQYGAHGAGQQGLSHRQIIAHYYPGTQVDASTALGRIRVAITADGDGVMRVAHRPGLSVGNETFGSHVRLPGGYDQWRVRTTGSGNSASDCVLQGRQGSSSSWGTVWPSGLERRCPITFRSSAESSVDLYLPNGDLRVYRGRLTAVHTGSSSLTTVNAVHMRQYLWSVVSAEMPRAFHQQALRAQAVAARTYAARGEGGRSGVYDTCDSTACQVYRGSGNRGSGGGISPLEYSEQIQAVDNTDDQLLRHEGRLATTMYSSSNGGHTAPAQNPGFPYLAAKQDPYDGAGTNPSNARHSWSAQLPVTALENRYGIHRVERVQITERDGNGRWGGRVLEAAVEGYDSSGRYVRRFATGNGLRLAHPWPRNAGGLSSNYFTLVAEEQAQPVRLGGDNRYEVAQQVSRFWTAPVPVAYVTAGDTYADALGASARAGVYGAPVLLVKSDAVPRRTVEALERLEPQRLVVVGGERSVTPGVEQQLQSYTGGSVTRVGGRNRWEVAAELASYYPPRQERVWLVNGAAFADATSAAAVANHRQEPLLLARPDRIDAPTEEQLRRMAGAEVVVVGGPASVPRSVAETAARMTGGGWRRHGGSNRYDVNASVVIREFPAGRSPSFVASGRATADALVGSALSGSRGAPMVLSRPDRIDSATNRALEHLSPSRMYVLGGTTSMPPAIVEALGEYLQ